MIQCADPHAQYLSHQAEIEAAVGAVMRGGRYILGEELATFEAEFAGYIGCQLGVGVGSGTEAIVLALKAAGVGVGHEVVTTAHTAVATVAAIESCGAMPVLVDIEPDFYTMDARLVERALTSRTRAIIPVHLYGQACEMEGICDLAKARGLTVIEDCAQSHGAIYKGRRLGTWGHAACFSFYPTKNLGAIGDGGLVASNFQEIAERVRLLREYGWRRRYVSEIPGINSRLDEIQAAVLRVKLRSLDADNRKRAALAAVYERLLDGLPLGRPKVRSGAVHVYHLYVVRSGLRESLQEALKREGIGTLVHYPIPIHLQPAYKGRLGTDGSFPETERASREILSLPMYPELGEERVVQICKTLHRVCCP
jgi:dTDP-4-amino-4,6-dideoxygalactose transaminase